MKKHLILFAVFLTVFVSGVQAYAQGSDSDDGKRMTTAERKETIQKLVVKKENGDVVVGQNPAADPRLKSQAPRVPGYLMDLMLHIDPNLDFEKFNKFMVKFAGDTGTMYVSQVLKACDDYLATNNMRLKPVKFQPNNIRNRIDNGLPYFIILYNSDGYGKINQRSMNRPETGDMKDWQKTLRKDAFKDKAKDKSKITWALLRGYNKQTNEYFVQVDGKNIWMSDAEIKLLLYNMYEPRI